MELTQNSTNNTITVDLRNKQQRDETRVIKKIKGLKLVKPTSLFGKTKKIGVRETIDAAVSQYE